METCCSSLRTIHCHSRNFNIQEKELQLQKSELKVQSYDSLHRAVVTKKSEERVHLEHSITDRNSFIYFSAYVYQYLEKKLNHVITTRKYFFKLLISVYSLTEYNGFSNNLTKLLNR